MPRRPVGEHAMTAAERSRRRRERLAEAERNSIKTYAKAYSRALGGLRDMAGYLDRIGVDSAPVLRLHEQLREFDRGTWPEIKHRANAPVKSAEIGSVT